MDDLPTLCPYCASSETVRLGSADDGTSVFLCTSCDEEFVVAPDDAA